MKIKKTEMPLKDGETYYLPLIFEASMEPITEGGGYFSTPGGHCLMLNKESVRALRVEVGKTYRCRDCKYAKPVAGRCIYCELQKLNYVWDKMCSACEHYEPRKELNNE